MATSVRHVSFSEENNREFATYTPEEYERGFSESELEGNIGLLGNIEEELKNRIIVTVTLSESELEKMKFCDFYELEADDVPEFGVCITEKSAKLDVCDILIYLDGEDCLELNALGIKRKVEDLKKRSKSIEVVVGRKK